MDFKPSLRRQYGRTAVRLLLQCGEPLAASQTALLRALVLLQADPLPELAQVAHAEWQRIVATGLTGVLQDQLAASLLRFESVLIAVQLMTCPH
jgi:hypothetical protein